jgi:hypothetical protein
VVSRQLWHQPTQGEPQFGSLLAQRAAQIVWNYIPEHVGDRFALDPRDWIRSLPKMPSLVSTKPAWACRARSTTEKGGCGAQLRLTPGHIDL